MNFPDQFIRALQLLHLPSPAALVPTISTIELSLPFLLHCCPPSLAATEVTHGSDSSGSDECPSRTIDMDMEHKEEVPHQGSSGTNIPGSTQIVKDEKLGGPPGTNEEKAEDDYENLNYPPAWKFEKYFIGGYSQKRMFKFKKPKSMYTAINLFAGEWDKLLFVIFRSADCVVRCRYYVLWASTDWRIAYSCLTRHLDTIKVSCPK